MTEQFANNAQGVLAAPITAAQTTISVTPTDYTGRPAASNFPTQGNFRIVVQSFDITTQQPTSASEIMLVTAVAGNTFTVTRGAESTTAIAFASGASVTHIVTAQVMKDLQSGGGGVQSVTGLNTDNTDPANPIVKISVDNSTIIGSGTPADPLVATGGGGGSIGGSTGSTDNAILRANGTGGSTLQNSLVTIDDSGNIAGVGASFSGLTASQIVATDASKNLQTLAVATYPSLTELSYVKGVTSAIQTQIDGKQASGTYVTSVSGTTNRITSSGGTTPAIDISASYIGQTSITTLGTIGTGTWNATAITATYGGTGIDSHTSTGIAQVSSGTWSVSTALANGTTATTQSANDASTKVATTAYADTSAATGKNQVTGIPIMTPSTAALGNATLTVKMPFAGTINSLYGAQTTSGSLTLAVKINGTNVTGLSAVSITSTPGDTSASGANTFSAGDTITFVSSSASSDLGASWVLKITRS